MNQRKPNVKLKVYLFANRIKQGELSRRSGIAQSLISEIINGAWIPNEEQVRKIVLALGVDQKQVF